MFLFLYVRALLEGPAGLNTKRRALAQRELHLPS
jgi:hypothetical protein